MRQSFFGFPTALVLSALCSLVLVPVAARAESALACNAPANLARFDQPLSRTSQRLKAGLPVTIVAIGSSSTAGAFASSSAASYPSRLEVELRERFPGAAITVLNRGSNGEEAADMLARLDKVLAETPDLIIWQVGTNAVLRDHNIDTSGALIRDGLTRMKATGADVVLMDPQFSPKVIAKPDAERMVDLINATAKTENVDLFHRFAVMRSWVETDHIGFETFVSPDGVHMNDWSYGCVAKVLAMAITEAATRATAVAGAGAPRF